MLYTHIAAALISAAIAATGAWKVQSWRYGEQIASMKQEASEATAKAVKAAMDKTLIDQKRKDDALIEANKRAQYNAVAADSARRAAVSLRDQLAAARASLPTISCEASREYASRLSEVFGQCTERLTEVARQADDATNAAMTLDHAWPE